MTVTFLAENTDLALLIKVKEYEYIYLNLS